MSRPDIELSEEAAAYVERHPELVEQLAGRADDRSADTPEVAQMRVKVRDRIRERLAVGRTVEAQTERQAAGQAFLARYGLQ